MKKMKILLILSLCVNLLLVGLFAGGALNARKKHTNSGPRDEIGAVLFYAPDYFREKIRRDMRKSTEGRREMGRGAQLGAFVEILKAPELNQEELESYFERSRKFNNESAKEAHTQIIESLSDLTREERREIASKLESQIKREHKK